MVGDIMIKKSTKILNIIIGITALLPLFAVMMAYIETGWTNPAFQIELFTGPVTLAKIAIIITIGICTVYGILMLAQPLAEEVEAKGRLI